MKVKKVTPTLAHIEIESKRITLTYGCSPTAKPAVNTVQFLGCIGGSCSRVNEDEHARGRKVAAREMARARVK